ncbi:MAG: HAMP domain-containing histidine kinase [Deltaproteobacteria bacterium]|nr:HAMP domain-containing histidine kinase [Deltaproteobacteria bacterium]MDQ3294997.1 HAMP domain-containing histidine kinase [Myxococcota bacterium]
MVDDEKPEPPHRDTTDESLRAERHKTDKQLEGSLGAIKRDAEEVVAEARDKADTLLSEARDVEDQKLASQSLPGGISASVSDAIDNTRAREDAVLVEERKDADIAAEQERTRRRLALASLLAHERQDTDLHLSLERTHADEALSSREDILALVSHDLRALLGGIALSADMLGRLAKAEQPDGQLVRYATSIQRFTASMNRLIGDLLDTASIEAGKLSVVPERRDAAHLLLDALDAFQPAALSKGIELTCEVGAEPLVAAFDYERILQVLTNLVGNSLKFTDKGGRIAIRLEPREGHLLFTVADNGRGIPVEGLEHVFARFFQANRNDRRGLGLGLFIAKSIIEAHGGRIWAASEPGKGSVFSFELPVAA